MKQSLVRFTFSLLFVDADDVGLFDESERKTSKMAAPSAPNFSSIVRAAAREASAAAQQHIEAVVASSMAQKSNLGSRFKAGSMPGRQVILS